MAGRAVLRDPMTTYRWRLFVDGMIRSTWAECSGLKSTLDEIKYAEGGSDTDQKSAGRKQYDDINLKTGKYSPGNPGSDDILDAALACHTLGDVGAASEYRFTAELVMFDNFDNEAERYEIRNAWIKVWTPVPGLNTSSEVAMEEAVIAHEGFVRR